MKLSKILKDKDLIVNEKEFSELVYTRQIRVDNKPVEDPNLVLEKDKKYLIKVGILEFNV